MRLRRESNFLQYLQMHLRGMGTLVIWIAALCVSSVGLFASSPAISVVSVRFNERRLPGQSYPWLEASVYLRSQTSVIPENINVTLWALFREANAKYAYVGHVKIFSLNDPATVRFYIPPDVLRTRRLSQSPYSYLIEISSSAGAEPFEHNQASPTLTTPAARAELKAMPAQPWLPHYLTPFYYDSDTFRDLPSYVLP